MSSAIAFDASASAHPFGEMLQWVVAILVIFLEIFLAHPMGLKLPMGHPIPGQPNPCIVDLGRNIVGPGRRLARH